MAVQKTYQQRTHSLRADHSKSQRQIAQYLYTARTAYFHYALGINELPIHHSIALCKYYNVSADYTLGLSHTKEK